MAVRRKNTPARRAASRTVKAQRAMQRRIDRRRSKKDEDSKSSVQLGGREYPAPPFPKQHQAKPGQESALDPAPLYDAPFYRGSERLKGQVAVITGGDSGIGRAVAVFFAREGADVAVMYLNEHKDAEVTKAAVEQEARDVAHFGEDTLMKRPAQPEEIAPAYVFLASNQCSSYITGEILPVIGGYT